MQLLLTMGSTSTGLHLVTYTTALLLVITWPPTEHLQEALRVVYPGYGLQPHMGSLASVLADLVPDLPDLLAQSHGSLDLQEVHGRLQLSQVHPGWLLPEPACGHLHPVVLVGEDSDVGDVGVEGRVPTQH